MGQRLFFQTDHLFRRCLFLGTIYSVVRIGVGRELRSAFGCFDTVLFCNKTLKIYKWDMSAMVILLHQHIKNLPIKLHFIRNLSWTHKSFWVILSLKKCIASLFFPQPPFPCSFQLCVHMNCRSVPIQKLCSVEWLFSPLLYLKTKIFLPPLSASNVKSK